MTDKVKITVVGAGYVGMSLGVLFAQKNNVMVHDINQQRVQRINNNESTIFDEEIEAFLSEKQLSLTATTDKAKAYKDANFIIVATPTSFDEDSHAFDTGIVDAVIEDALIANHDALVVIKSTIPVGHTEYLKKKHATDRIIFSPEFLREGSALKDNLFPTRIIIGGDSEQAKEFANLLIAGSKNKHISPMFMTSGEAEAVKLFSNTFLAMRIAFFNEMDSFAMANNLQTKDIIKGVRLDPRIGKGYDNPSFGYGGYCLPKDTKQLLANYKSIPQNLIEAIISSNESRKDFIAEQILDRHLNTIGFYRLVMKTKSDNYRSSSIIDIMQRLNNKGKEIIVYEPLLEDQIDFQGFRVCADLDEFKETAELIVTNRISQELVGVESKLFTRDIFGEN
jgi:UDPglucose 6-dehydrogenase